MALYRSVTDSQVHDVLERAYELGIPSFRQIDEDVEAELPGACAGSGAELEECGSREQFQEELPPIQWLPLCS